jgi:hypothetical protein
MKAQGVYVFYRQDPERNDKMAKYYPTPCVQMSFQAPRRVPAAAGETLLRYSMGNNNLISGSSKHWIRKWGIHTKITGRKLIGTADELGRSL